MPKVKAKIVCPRCSGKGYLETIYDIKESGAYQISETGTLQCSQCNATGEIVAEVDVTLIYAASVARASIKPRPAEFFLPTLLYRLGGRIEIILPNDISLDAKQGLLNFWSLDGCYPRIKKDGAFEYIVIEDKDNRVIDP